MATKRYKVLIAEIDGTDLEDVTEHGLDTSDALISMAGMVTTPEITATTASTKTLTTTSNSTQIFTGTTAAQVLKLPAANTLSLGHTYDVWNFSTQTIDIQDNAGTVLATLRAGSRTFILLRVNSTAAGTWALTYTLDTGNVFGNILYYQDADAETSTNSTTTFLNKISLTTPSLPIGDYLVQYQFNWRAANADRQIEFRVQRASADLDTGEPFSGSTADRPLISGFKRVQSISGVQTFTLDFRVGGSGTTVYMYNARLFVWRVA